MESTLSFARESGELCELPVLMRGAAWHAAPLASAPSRVALVTADFGGVALQVLRSEPGMLIIESAPDTAAIIRLFEGRARGRWDGRAIGAHDVALCGGELRHQAVLPDGWACIVLSLSGAAAETAAAPDTRPGSGAAAAVVPADPGVLSELAEIAHAIEQAATDRASPLFDPEARRSLRAALLDAARRIFASPVPGLAAGRRDGTASQRIVHAANDYLRANPVRPIYTDELCAAIGVSATRTHQAFVETFCLSPHRFLKLRRMGMVRAALLSRAEPRRSIKHVALSHGFWHLGQFARDYRLLFGETPSATLARVWSGMTSGARVPGPRASPAPRPAALPTWPSQQVPVAAAGAAPPALAATVSSYWRRGPGQLAGRIPRDGSGPAPGLAPPARP